MKNDMIEPIEFYGQGSCPICRKRNLVIEQAEKLNIYIDKEGQPKEYESIVGKMYVICKSCGFKGVVGEDYMRLENGSYKYVTEAEKIYETNRIKNLPEKTHLHAEGNPFVDMMEIEEMDKLVKFLDVFGTKF